MSSRDTVGDPHNSTMVGHFRIEGMTCAACVGSVENVLKKLIGVSRASVALATEMGEVEYDPRYLDKKQIVDAIEDAGFDAKLVESGRRDQVKFLVAGMSTEAGRRDVEGVLQGLEGIRQVTVDSLTEKMEIFFDPEVIGLRAIVDAVESRGDGDFRVVLPNLYTSFSPERSEEVGQVYKLFLWSCIFSVSFLKKMPFKLGLVNDKVIAVCSSHLNRTGGLHNFLRKLRLVNWNRLFVNRYLWYLLELFVPTYGVYGTSWTCGVGPSYYLIGSNGHW